MTPIELASQIAVELIRKSSTGAYPDDAACLAVGRAASLIVCEIYEHLGDMEVPNKLLYTEMDGTPKQIVFADHAADFNPTAANDLRKTTDGSQELDVQLSTASLANGSYRQSAKFDFGENWATEYQCRGAFELAATPTAGRTINCFLAYSQSATAGTGNSGNASGSDAAYTGYSSNAAAAVLQLHQISAFVVTGQAAATVQEIEGWTFAPRGRYACLIVQNDVGSAFDSDDIQTHIVLNPVPLEVQ
jgi:hypothetical protein